jgi:hypothetical protein
MTNQEAIGILRRAVAEVEWEYPMEIAAAIDKAIDALAKDNNVLNSGWISVKDALPKDAGIYIIVDHYGNVMSRHFCKSHGRFSGYWHFNGSAKYGNPRYWMKMPKAPKMEGK